MFKAFIASAAIAATSLVAPAAVEAATSVCYTTTKYDTVCIHSVRWNRSNPNFRKVASTLNGGSFSVDNVTCNPAHRYNYKRNLSGIACFEFH